MNTGNVVFVDFSKEVAEYLHKNFTSYLSDNSLREFTSNLRKANMIWVQSVARKWIDDDVKIAGSAKMVRKLDALLTGDYKTFCLLQSKWAYLFIIPRIFLLICLES
ncbi:MAG: hypothetical protein WKG06_13485 [Segetibacter sp.]